VLGVVAALIGIALVAGGRDVSAGMGLNSDNWAQLERDAYFVGAFVDWQGARASFFVDVKTAELIGPFDHQVAKGPVHGLPASSSGAPPSVAVGTRGVVKFWGMVPTQRIGQRPGKRVGPRMASDPDTDLDGTFIAFAPAGVAVSQAELVAKQADPLLLGLVGAKPGIWALTDGTMQRRALRGLVLGEHEDLARALVREKLWAGPRTAQNDVLASFGLLIDGLPGMVSAPPCTVVDANSCHPLYPLMPAAREWLAGRRDEAKRLLQAVVKLPCCYAMPREAFGPMEYAPQQPVAGPFVRGDFVGRDYGEFLKVRAPEFTALLVDCAHRHRNPTAYPK